MRNHHKKFWLLAAPLALLMACGSDGGDGEGDDSSCGDGELDVLAGEQCDDGNNLDGDGCSAACQTEPGGPSNEVCDDGFDNDADGATDCDDDDCGDAPGCTGDGVCGDGVVNGDEECDDGNDVDDDGCDTDCTNTPGGGEQCGDGVVEGDEECDDGNTDDGDGCSSTCAFENECGNGTVEDGEECDDGNTDDGDGCSSSCAFENECGNGTVEDGEECDDGNTDDGDGCASDCTLELSFDCGDEADVVVLNVEGSPFGNGFSWTGTTADWSDDSSTIDGCTATGGADAVFVYEAGQTGFARFTAANEANTADVSLVVYRDNCGTGDVVSCGEDSVGGDAELVVAVAAGSQYFMRVEANSGGDVTVAVESVSPPAREGEMCGGVGQVCEDGLTCIDGECADIPGTCDAALPIEAVLTGTWETGFSGSVPTSGLPAQLSGACGGEGREVVLQLTPPEDVFVEVEVTSPVNATAYLRSACANETFEFACGSGGVFERVRAARPSFLILDSAAPYVPSFEVVVTVRPLGVNGDACGEGIGGCEAGLLCNDVGICRPEAAASGEACGTDPEDAQCEDGLVCAAQDAGQFCRASDANTCSAPVDLNAIAVVDGGTSSATLTLGGAPAGAYSPNCAPDANTLASWTATTDGLLEITATATDGSTLQSLSVRDGCADRGTEQFCDLVTTGSTTALVDVTSGQELFLLLGGSGDVRLTLRAVGERGLGESCDRGDSSLFACGPGLICNLDDVCEVFVPYSCADPLEPEDGFGTLATEVTFDIDLRVAGSNLEGTCGGDGNEAVIEFLAPESGNLNLEWSTTTGTPIIHVQDACGDQETERLCLTPAEDSDFADLVIPVAEGERVLVVLDVEGASVEGGNLIARLRSPVGEGGTCEDDRSCELGLACVDEVCEFGSLDIGDPCDARLADDQCTSGATCQATGSDTAACYTAGAYEALCDSRDECRDGLACALELGDAVGRCVVPSAAGRSCVPGSCEFGFACDARNTCVPAETTADAACDWFDSSCGDGLGCAALVPGVAGGVCTELREGEAECTSDEACVDGFYCAGLGIELNGVCQRVLAPGEACERSAACDNGFCVGVELDPELGVCVPRTGRRVRCQPERLDACPPGGVCVGELGEETCQVAP